MTTLFSGLNNALRTLQIMQKGIETTSHNVSNASTPGYSRQKVLLQASDPYTVPSSNRPMGVGQVGTGVQATEIKRYRSEFLDGQIRTQTSNLKGWEVRQDTLQQVEVILNEPSDTGLNTYMTNFWSGWQELAASPDSAASRAQVAEGATELTSSLRESHRQLTELQTDLDNHVSSLVTEINDLAYNIADYNRKIAHVESIGQQANDMRDERDVLLKTLSEKLNVTMGENENGSTMVSVGGRLLVMDFEVNEMAVRQDPTNNMLNSVVWADSGDPVTLKGIPLAGGLDADAENLLAGELGGTLIGRDIILPRQMAVLDDIANTLIGSVNGLHQTGYGLNNLPGATLTATTTPGTVDAMTQVATGSWAGLSGLPAGNMYVETRDNGGTLQFRLVDSSGNPLAINNASLPDPVAPAVADPAVDITDAWQDFSLVAGTTLDTGRGIAITFGALDPNGVVSTTTDANVAGFSTGGVAQGATELSDGARYYVEVNASNQFRLVDDTGTAVQVYDLTAANGSLSDGWQDIPVGGTFDTSRGLTVQFNGAPAVPPYLPRQFGGTPAPASAEYSAWGNQIATAANGAAQVTMGNFFSGSGAATIALSDYIEEDYSRIATASTPNAPGDGSVALHMYQLSSAALLNNNTTTLTDYYRAAIGTLGQDAQQANTMTENHETLVDHLETRQEEVAGVSVDEETVNLIEYQRAYQAAARVLNTFDEMLDKVINGMGLVGR